MGRLAGLQSATVRERLCRAPQARVQPTSPLWPHCQHSAYNPSADKVFLVRKVNGLLPGVGECFTIEAQVSRPRPSRGRFMTDWSDKHLTEQDLYLFNEGSNYRLYHKFGSHPCVKDGVTARTSPSGAGAERVTSWAASTAGTRAAMPCGHRDPQAFGKPSAGVGAGESYKYHISSNHNGYQVDKCDPIVSTPKTRRAPPPLSGRSIMNGTIRRG